MRIVILVFLCALSSSIIAQPSKSNIHRVLGEVNLLRSQGYQCGNQKMPAVGPVRWNSDLHKVSNKYARYMSANKHFDHVSKKGEDLGDRLDNISFDWIKIGENLGHGYNDFYDVFEAWKESPSHCKMLMDPDMTDMGMSKYKTYWVQSFSKAHADIALGDN